MSKLKSVVRAVEDVIEEEKYHEDWCEAADCANKASEWARDRDLVVDKLLKNRDSVAYALDSLSDGDVTLTTMAELRTHLETNLEDWRLWGLGEDQGVTFAVWDFYPCDGHLAFLVAREGPTTLVTLVDTN